MKKLIREKIELKYTTRRQTTTVDKHDNITKTVIVTLHGSGELELPKGRGKDTIAIDVKFTGERETIKTLLKGLNLRLKDHCLTAFAPNLQNRLDEYIPKEETER